MSVLFPLLETYESRVPATIGATPAQAARRHPCLVYELFRHEPDNSPWNEGGRRDRGELHGQARPERAGICCGRVAAKRSSSISTGLLQATPCLDIRTPGPDGRPARAR